MSTSRLMPAEVCAVIAAALNGSIGSLTRFGFHGGASHDQVAFWKCFLAFLALLIFCLVNSAQRSVVLSLRYSWKSFLFLSFFGVFCLYFFETWAFQEASIPLVSFLTYAAGGATIILSSIFLKEQIGFYKITAFVAIIAGVYLIFLFDGGIEGSYLGICLALLGGLGYAIFIFSSKLLGVGGGVAQLENKRSAVLNAICFCHIWRQTRASWIPRSRMHHGRLIAGATTRERQYSTGRE
jgi:DME family drug/metabolite transporter